MPRSRRRALVVIGVIAVVDIIVFLIDLQSPPGLHEWLLYLTPIVICLFSDRPWLPPTAALASTGLLALGFQDKLHTDYFDGLVNRGIGAGVIWLLALGGSRFISSRNRIEFDRWLKEGHARLSDAMQNERDRGALATRVLAETCRRIGAQTGALFVSRGHGPYEFVEGYAVAPSRVAQAPSFKLGEGIVGQAAREKRVIRISDISPGYSDIASGLAVTPPREVIVAPLPANGGVEGVLELGFVRRAPNESELYLENVGESIGAAFRAVQYQENLQHLLETSRAQAAELEQQSISLQASQRTLEEQQAELEQTNQDLAKQSETLQQQQRELERRNDELRRLHRSLEQKTSELEQTSHYKSEFLANMSHELRTPLNSALILARLLADNRAGNLSQEQVRWAETIHRAGIDLLSLINDVLDISKVEAGKLVLETTTFSLDDIVASVEQEFHAMAAAKGITLSVSATRGAKIQTDHGRLAQVLRNLIANAIKFTERGSVELAITLDGEDAIFRVRDTGIGIASEELERIFDAFHQAEIAGTRPAGTGLGLSIARRLAILMGGEIAVQSTPGVGSVFTLRIPHTYVPQPATEPRLPMRWERPSAAATPRIESARKFEGDRGALDPARRTVLVIEDDEHFAFVLYELVRGLEHQCVVANTGTDGLAMANEHRPDAIILDIKLPDQSGLAVLEQLKSSPRTRHIPVHVLSILDRAQTAREMGAVSTMLKPAKREEIIQALSDLAVRSKRQPKTVLVVEDNPAQRDAIRALIAQDDVKVTTAQTAREALDLLGGTTFDCVVLDLGLPDMSGFELVEKMAAGERYAHPPVIIYTGRELSSGEEERLQRHTRTIVLKGARSPDRLIHEVTLFLHKLEEQLPPEHQRLLDEVRLRDRSLDGKCILVVDDDARSVYALTHVLEQQRARVRIARNGREALDEIDRDAKVDLVVMDMMMPVLDGHAAIAQIRAKPQFANLPIIALTARAMPDDRERCLEVGANDYLAKPVEVDRLLTLLRVWSSHRRGLFR